MLDQRCDLEARPSWVRRQFLADHRASNLKRKYGTTAKRCIFVDEISSSAGHNSIVNIELTKVKVTVVINLKWSNLDYPSCHLVGRPHLTFPVTTKIIFPEWSSCSRLRELAGYITFCIWPSTISTSITRTVRLVRHEACMGQKVYVRFCWEIPIERKRWEDLDVNGTIK